MNTLTERYPWLWDVDMDNATFEAILRGQTSVSGLGTDWAMLRLIEYAPYREIKRLLPLAAFLIRWPALKSRVRALSRRDGMDFWADWARREGEAHV
jgi:hypothetical protein